MFFNSATFLFAFLPLVLGGYLVLERKSPLMVRQIWLLAASLVFYAWSNPAVLALFLPLTVFNYLFGKALSRGGHGRWLVTLAVTLNVLVLCYFKYANFFVGNLNALLQTNLFIEKILLPLGISFITFMQIAWLVASHRREAVACTYFEFLLYSAFFPQIVSGPIVYQRESLPQFRKVRGAEERDADLCVGATLFTMGLAKKVLIADTLAPWATQVFWAAGEGHSLSLAAAWIGALAYAFQLYFDFSGYSDMAIGVARMFGVRLPLNFDSPYKAESISDFWRRWHMTLSRFLRDYVYIPLGGSRCGAFRRSLNLFLTMVIGGFWHGAGWTFLLWGALHGGYLVINHLWTSAQEARPWPGAWILKGWGGRLLTFAAVLVAWIFFRASEPGEAWTLLQGLVGTHGWLTSADPLFQKSSPILVSALSHVGLPLDPQTLMLVTLGVLAGVVWFFPNSQQLLASMSPGLVTYGKTIPPLERPFQRLAWKPSGIWFLATTLLFLWCLLNLSHESSFLYRDF
jgi:D-alanyl-lipoteichoic acid acyltransferase DltB (MBOAT superfamily)